MSDESGTIRDRVNGKMSELRESITAEFDNVSTAVNQKLDELQALLDEMSAGLDSRQEGQQ